MAEPSTQHRRQLVQSSTLGAGIALAALLLGLVNYFGWKYYQRFDWTEANLYSLSEKSVNVTRSLDRDVEVVVFTSPAAPLADEVQELLARYEALTPRLQVRVIDPVKNLVEAQRLLEELDARYVEGSVKVVFRSGGERRVIEESDLAEMDFSSLQFGGEPEIEAFTGEEAFTGALVELSSGERPKVLFTTGHGEKKLDDFSGGGFQGVQELLGRDNVDFESWASLGQPAVPEGTDLVVVAGPTTPFVEPELQLFDDYLARGGRMLWLLDPVVRADGSLVDLGVGGWLAGYGVQVADDVVFDLDQAVPFFGAETFFVGSYGDHPAVKALSQGDLRVIFALARSVGEAGDAGGYQVTRLAETGPGGWGETDLASLPRVEAGEEDVQGPVSLAVAVEAEGEGESENGAALDDEAGEAAGGEEGEGEGEEAGAGEPATPRPGMRMVVVGDSDFGSDALLGSAANAVLLDNTFNWLLARETLLGIPPKKPEQVRLSLTSDQLLQIYLILGALPLAAIVAGVMVWARRRR